MTIDPQYVGHQLRTAGIRFDAGETVAFARQLESIAARTYDVVYPDPKSFSLIPIAAGVESMAEFYTWRAFDRAGVAKRIVNFADDVPTVDIQGTENITPIATYADGYQYTLFDMRRAQMLNVDLDQKRALAARDVLNRKIDRVAAFGDAEVNITGFVNNPNVPVVAPTTGNWATAADVQILSDLYKMEQTIVTNSRGLEEPDTLVVPPSTMGIIATKPAGVNLQDTVLDVFLRRSRFIRNVESWYQLETANAAGTGPRIVAYKRDPTKLELVLPLAFEQEPPQARNFAFVVNCLARCGGVVFYYPRSASYMDGI